MLVLMGTKDDGMAPPVTTNMTPRCPNQEHNSLGEHLGLLGTRNGSVVPGKRAGGVAFEARVDRSAATQADLLSLDLKVRQQNRAWVFVMGAGLAHGSLSQ